MDSETITEAELVRFFEEMLERERRQTAQLERIVAALERIEATFARQQFVDEGMAAFTKLLFEGTQNSEH